MGVLYFSNNKISRSEHTGVLYFSSKKIHKSGHVWYKYVCCTRCVISKTIKVNLKPTSVLEVSIFHLVFIMK